MRAFGNWHYVTLGSHVLVRGQSARSRKLREPSPEFVRVGHDLLRRVGVRRCPDPAHLVHHPDDAEPVQDPLAGEK